MPGKQSGQNQVSAGSRAKQSEDIAAEWVDIGSLVPWANNPRDNQSAIPKVARSIKRWGFGAPVVARRETGEIIAGHTRVSAAKSLGMHSVPVRFMDLTEDESRKMALADNRLNEDASWDKDVLSVLLDEWQGDADDMGFSASDIHGLVGDDSAVDVNEVDLTEAKAEFWLTVTGPLEMQANALDLLKESLGNLEGVDVSVVVSER